MRSLDLFSGLGGITYALTGYFEPELYCDIDAACQSVLAHHIDTGKLPTATLMTDVRSINSVSRDVRAIVGGSPCQSISCIGKRAGIAEGTKSGLFYEIFRIVDQNPHIDILFLENVSNILRVGVREVIGALAPRGFSMAWVVRHARGHGGPHKRARWFCLAVRDSASVPELDNFEPIPFDLPRWRREEEPCRIAVKPAFGIDSNYTPDWSKRHRLLGNSVVPIAVRKAFEELASRYSRWKDISDTVGDLGTPVGAWKCPTFPEHALVTRGKVIQLPTIMQELPEDAFRPSITLDVEGTLMSLKSWPTPRHGNTRAGRLTSRSMGDLGTAIVHSLESQVYVASSGLKVTGPLDTRMSDIAVPNPVYVEWMMGYPTGWTDDHYPEGQERTVWPVDGAPDPQLVTEDLGVVGETYADEDEEQARQDTNAAAGEGSADLVVDGDNDDVTDADNFGLAHDAMDVDAVIEANDDR